MSLPEFLAERVAADIRQQMDGVLALTGQLSRQRLTADGEACVASVAEAAEGVRRIVDAGRDLKAIRAQGLVLDLQPVVLREVMDEIQERWQPRAAATGVTLLVSFDGDPGAAAMADRKRLLQIFDGFIGEAVAAQARGAVETGLTVQILPDGVRLQGRVRGPRDTGWDDQDIESRIRNIADRLGLEVALGALLARNVVDDNATNRMVAQSLVEMFDCTSESAEDGEEAVEAAQTGRFDLILMDIRMPRMDGVAATRAIRALPGRIGAVPIIALTANADPDDAEGYLAAGMNGVVEKPMKPEHLLLALQQALNPDAAAAAA